jgi:tetratricopeptide (TPR) repeat protein
MKCLEKDRGRRYETANGLAANIERHLAGEPVLAAPPSKLYRLRKVLRRHRGPLAAAAALVLILTGATVISTVLWQHAEHESTIARDKAAEAEQISDFLRNMLASLNPERVEGRDLTLLLEVLDGAAKRVDTEFANRPDVQASLHITIGSTYHGLGQYDLAERHKRSTLEIRRAIPSDNRAELGETLESLAVTLWSLKQFAEAEELLREAIAINRQHFGEEHPKVARNLFNLAAQLRGQGKMLEAERINRQVLEMRRRMLGDTHPEVASSLSNLADLLATRGNPAEAESLMREALQLNRAQFGEGAPQVAQGLFNLASHLQAQGKLAEAETFFRDGLAIDRARKGNDHPRIAIHLDMLGRLLQARGNLDEARGCLREALSIRRQRFGDEHALVADVLHHLADVLRVEREFAEAERLAREALVIYGVRPTENAREHAHALEVLAFVFLDQDRFAEAGRAFGEMYALLSRALPDAESTIATAAVMAGVALLKHGTYGEAAVYLREGLAIRERLLHPDSPEYWRVAAARSLLGESLVGQGTVLIESKPAEASAKFVEAEPLLLDGYDGMKNSVGMPKRVDHMREALERIVRLYEAWDDAEPGQGHAEKSADWRARLEVTMTPPETAKPGPSP